MGSGATYATKTKHLTFAITHITHTDIHLLITFVPFNWAENFHADFVSFSGSTLFEDEDTVAL